jgi:probable rRNA maturation factor
MIRMLVKVVNNHPHIKLKTHEVRKLINYVINDEEMHSSRGEINLIFVDDDYLRGLHRNYLNDDSFTDVMSFKLNNNAERLDGEIYISVDRAKYYSQKLKIPLDSEIARLIIHGLLHLKGHDDSTEFQQREMRRKEDYYLGKYFQSLNLL